MSGQVMTHPQTSASRPVAADAGPAVVGASSPPGQPFTEDPEAEAARHFRHCGRRDGDPDVLRWARASG